MIKCLLIVIGLLLSIPVYSQSFYKMRSVPDTSKFERVQIDESYELYVKRICKKFVNDIAEPCNCTDLPEFTIEEVVEYEYMFLSKKHNKIIVINYIKDRNQKFYTKPSPGLFETKSKLNEVEINIWYFNQLRFGNYNPLTNIARFQTTFKPHNIHQWKLDVVSDTVKIHSVAIEQKDGFEEKISEKSMALVPVFLRANKYKIFYQYPSYESNYDTHLLPDNNLYVDTESGNIYFIFNSEIFDGGRTIKFKGNRLYSYFLPKKASNNE